MARSSYTRAPGHKQPTQLAPTANGAIYDTRTRTQRPLGTYNTQQQHAQRCCNRLRSRPLTPSKARAGWWESKPVCCITLEPVSLTLRRSVLGSRVSDTKLVPGDTGYALPISRIHLIGYLVEDGITSSVHAKHTFSRTSKMLRFAFCFRSCIIFVRTPPLGTKGGWREGPDLPGVAATATPR